jgi:hypothetical protein
MTPERMEHAGQEQRIDLHRRVDGERDRGRVAALVRLNYIRNATLALCGSEDHSAPPRRRTRDRCMP